MIYRLWRCAFALQKHRAVEGAGPYNITHRKAECVLKTQKLTRMALLTAIALTIFMVESQIPPIVPLPGVKLGLSNIITVYAVFVLGPKEAAAILFVRIFLGAVFGSFGTIFYSAAGGALAILVTIGLRKLLTKKQLWVAGSLGAVAHSVGQVLMAALIYSTPELLVFYLPPLIAISIVTGLFTGLCAQFLVNRGKNLWKITSK